MTDFEVLFCAMRCRSAYPCTMQRRSPRKYFWRSLGTLRLGKSRRNLRGWIFCVAHNLALKRRYANQRSRDKMTCDWTIAQRQFDPSPSPEEQVSLSQRQRRLLAVLHALPEEDQRCLRLRAEGLRYREISAVLGISLAAVSMSLTGSLARLMRADRR